MEEYSELDITINFGFFLVIIGILEALFRGLSVLKGGLAGIIVGIVSSLGVIPVIGQIMYMKIVNAVFSELDINLVGLYWIGFIVSVMISVFVIFIIIKLKFNRGW